MHPSREEHLLPALSLPPKTGGKGASLPPAHQSWHSITLGPAQNVTAGCPRSSQSLPAIICSPAANCRGRETLGPSQQDSGAALLGRNRWHPLPGHYSWGVTGWRSKGGHLRISAIDLAEIVALGLTDGYAHQLHSAVPAPACPAWPQSSS